MLSFMMSLIFFFMGFFYVVLVLVCLVWMLVVGIRGVVVRCLV